MLGRSQAEKIVKDAVRKCDRTGMIFIDEYTPIFGRQTILDSLSVVEVLMAVEKELLTLGIEVDLKPEDAQTVGSLRDYLMTLG